MLAINELSPASDACKPPHWSGAASCAGAGPVGARAAAANEGSADGDGEALRCCCCCSRGAAKGGRQPGPAGAACGGWATGRRSAEEPQFRCSKFAPAIGSLGVYIPKWVPPRSAAPPPPLAPPLPLALPLSRLPVWPCGREASDTKLALRRGASAFGPLAFGLIAGVLGAGTGVLVAAAFRGPALEPLSPTPGGCRFCLAPTELLPNRALPAGNRMPRPAPILGRALKPSRADMRPLLLGGERAKLWLTALSSKPSMASSSSSPLKASSPNCTRSAAVGEPDRPLFAGPPPPPKPASCGAELARPAGRGGATNAKCEG
mmetsp:Transcript_156096/g.500648  ORF Transcript_156096/g.500648 Transcript_156096/m.500648 type:complete len:319 (+) Transcript_156096:2462-3418(+)